MRDFVISDASSSGTPGVLLQTWLPVRGVYPGEQARHRDWMIRSYALTLGRHATPLLAAQPGRRYPVRGRVSGGSLGLLGPESRCGGMAGAAAPARGRSGCCLTVAARGGPRPARHGGRGGVRTRRGPCWSGRGQASSTGNRNARRGVDNTNPHYILSALAATDGYRCKIPTSFINASIASISMGKFLFSHSTPVAVITNMSSSRM